MRAASVNGSIQPWPVAPVKAWPNGGFGLSPAGTEPCSTVTLLRAVGSMSRLIYAGRILVGFVQDEPLKAEIDRRFDSLQRVLRAEA